MFTKAKIHNWVATQLLFESEWSTTKNDENIGPENVSEYVNGALSFHFGAHIGNTGPGEFPEDGEMNLMTIFPRHCE